MSKEFIKGTGAAAETAPVVEEKEFSEEENKAQVRLHEEDFIAGLLEAADFAAHETQEIEVAREGKVFFKFNIRPLTADEINTCRNRASKFVRNKQLGLKMLEDTDSVKYRSMLIYTATTAADKEKLWDNKKVWDGLEKKGKIVVTGYEVVGHCLKAGEMAKIIDIIDELSGFESSNLEEVAKN